MWEIKNGARERHNGDFKSEIFYPNRYEPVQEDGTIICGEGVVTDDLITDEFRSLARKVICGEIEDPTNGALCFLGYEALGYDDPDEFAKKFAIEKYIVIGRHIFFYEWTEELNNL